MFICLFVCLFVRSFIAQRDCFLLPLVVFAYFLFFSIFIDLKMARHTVAAQYVCFQLVFFFWCTHRVIAMWLFAIEWNTHAFCSICQVCLCNGNVVRVHAHALNPAFEEENSLYGRLSFPTALFLQLLLIRKARTRRKTARERERNSCEILRLLCRCRRSIDLAPHCASDECVFYSEFIRFQLKFIQFFCHAFTWFNHNNKRHFSFLCACERSAQWDNRQLTVIKIVFLYFIEHHMNKSELHGNQAYFIEFSKECFRYRS